MTRAVFAIPGDKDRRTGGFLYEAAVLRGLNANGCATRHLQLPDSFPDPTPADMAATLDALMAVPADTPIILDGFVSGTIDPDGLSRVAAPVIAMVHHPLGLETGLDRVRAKALRASETAALRHMSHVIVPSPHTRDVLVKSFGVDPSRITVALPGFTRPVLRNQPADPPLILSVGILAERKGHDVLLDALARISDLVWQARIVGKTHDMRVADALRMQCQMLGLSDRVTFTGELGPAELSDTFNAASVFALATRYEGYGMVLSEAMLYGLPVVSCAVGAVPDTVGAAGLLTPPDDPAAFAAALRRLLEDPAAATQQRALSISHAATLPTWDDTVAIFKHVIDHLTPA